MDSKPKRRRRPLYEWEKIEAQIVFGNSLDYERVRINEGVRWPDTFNIIGRRLKKMPPPRPNDHNAITIGFSCNFPVNLPETNPSPGHPDEFFVIWLIHELTHCWQYQHKGPIYIVRALSAQFRSKGEAYYFGGEPNLINVRSAGGNIYSFNSDAQAEIAQAYYLRLRKNLTVTAFVPYINDIRMTPVTAFGSSIGDIRMGSGAAWLESQESRSASKKSSPRGLRQESDPGKSKSVTTHTRLESDNYAYLGKPFVIKVKLSDQPQSDAGDHTSTSEIEIPAHEGEIVPVVVKLQAPDFDLASDQTGWFQEIKFFADASASSTAKFKLVPRDRLLNQDFSAIRAVFIVRGNIVGEVFKWVEVLHDESIPKTEVSHFPKAPQFELDENGQENLPYKEAPVVIPDKDYPTPSMTVTISKMEGKDFYQWDIVVPGIEEDQYPNPSESPYKSSDLGASQYVKNYLSPLVGNLDNNGNLSTEGIGLLFGFLLDLRDNAPKAFWEVYELALQKHIENGKDKNTFSILFITDDSFIPWELMPVQKELGPDRSLPPLLGSIHRVGRWLHGVSSLQPPVELNLQGFSLAVPKYENRPLNAAENAREFFKKYDPYWIEKEGETFSDVFKSYMATGQPTNGTGILHYSGHGNCCTNIQRAVWLELDDYDNFYSIYQAKNEFSNYLGKAPEESPTPTFAFFNACKAGFTQQNALGSIGGWARALLYNDYDGYVGPLWSVEDNHASLVSEMFYTKAIDEGLPLGEVLRQIREKFTKDNRLFTYIAYVYFGHPLTTITYAPFEENYNVPN